MIRIERPLRFALFLVGTLLVVALIGIGVTRVAIGPSLVGKSGTITVAEGSSARTIWQQAVTEGFSDHTTWWRYYAWRQDAAGSIKTGSYQVTAGEKISDVVGRLVVGDTTASEVRITYPEGFTLEQMAARTAANGIGTVDEFMQAATPALFADQGELVAHIPPGRDLEGYLFPDTYRVFADDTPADVIRRMLGVFNERFTAEMRAEATGANRTVDQVVIMASIIEREVQHDEDMALVAGVLWKRLEDGVGLGADATVRYAIDNWDEPLTVQDLAVDSPYNTRRYRGLPPGPISNPGVRALTAALRPTPSDYYYYLSTPAGETIFSRTLEEHNQQKAIHLN